MTTNEPRFICRLELVGPHESRSTTPPDSDFLAAVVKGMNLHDFAVSGMDTHFLKIDARGVDASSRLEYAFRRHFTWGFVVSPAEPQEGI